MIDTKASMKTAPIAPSFVTIALVAGLGLAALCKLVYDLFNGYTVVPNLLDVVGLRPSAVLLEVLQFLALATTAFTVGNALLRKIADPSGRLLVACAVPWVALCAWGFISGLVSEHGEVLRELTGRSASSIAAPLLMILAVPFGLWVAYRCAR
jgi:hypothetical protein